MALYVRLSEIALVTHRADPLMRRAMRQEECPGLFRSGAVAPPPTISF
jgi:hypothetical protein